jgi:hypothetical protein
MNRACMHVIILTDRESALGRLTGSPITTVSHAIPKGPIRDHRTTTGPPNSHRVGMFAPSARFHLYTTDPMSANEIALH